MDPLAEISRRELSALAHPDHLQMAELAANVIQCCCDVLGFVLRLSVDRMNKARVGVT